MKTPEIKAQFLFLIFFDGFYVCSHFYIIAPYLAVSPMISRTYHTQDIILLCFLYVILDFYRLCKIV